MCSFLSSSAGSYSGPPSNSYRPFSFLGKCPGTQSRITPMPAAWKVSTMYLKSSGVPYRDVGA